MYLVDKAVRLTVSCFILNHNYEGVLLFIIKYLDRKESTRIRFARASLDNHHLLNPGQITQQSVLFSHFCLVFCNHQSSVTGMYHYECWHAWWMSWYDWFPEQRQQKRIFSSVSVNKNSFGLHTHFNLQMYWRDDRKSTSTHIANHTSYFFIG